MQDEAISVLSKLLQFNTVNPPGNERVGMQWLSDYLTDAGFACEMVALDEERPNLVARLKGEAPGPTLGYLSHMDTVPANAADWDVDPWSGALKDGFVWGRGAVDMKNQTAAEAVAGATLARLGWRPKKGELKIICVADEETGGEWGAEWLVKEHAELAHCDMLVNEGGWMIPYEGRRNFGVSVAEKGAFRFKVKTHGIAGHASVPIPENNALLKLAPIIEHLGRTRLSYNITDSARTVIEAFGEDPSDPKAAVARLADKDPRLVSIVEPILGITFSPSCVSASDKINVIPAHAELAVDCRYPPGLSVAEVEAVVRHHIEEVCPADGYDLETGEGCRLGSASVSESPLMDAISEWVTESDPGSKTIPTALVASSDSTHFRNAFPESVVYGFFPMRKMDLFELWPLVHAKNERIYADDLGFATKFFADLPAKLLV